MDTNVAYVAQDKWSGLARYISHVAAVYHCPEDNFLSPAQRGAGFIQRSRSISMNWVLGDGRMDSTAYKTRGAGTDLWFVVFSEDI
ncbi:MAG TPA: hypothetical protein VL361_21280 [Candidatus Limnocylindrales bacterium]|nr:hypothetical protein [Candidatus Limnocylindrales bacterium]